MLRKTLNLEIMKNSSGRVRVAKKVRVGSGSGYSSNPGGRDDAVGALLLLKKTLPKAQQTRGLSSA